MLEGSVRKAAGKVRVTAQLIDARTGEHVWANRYDEEGNDVVTLQDDVAHQIYNPSPGVRGEIRKKEEAEAWRKSAPSLEEYDYYLRGHQLFFPLHQGRQRQGTQRSGRKDWRSFPTALLRTKTRLHLHARTSSTGTHR